MNSHCVSHEQVVDAAKQFLQARFGIKLQALQPPPVVHLITVSGTVNMRAMCNNGVAAGRCAATIKGPATRRFSHQTACLVHATPSAYALS